ncbi:hypothetical protein PVAP13_7KG284000 [Panicum virgatum]|uniref:Endonuclease/exonuclease/phosphatase domain-containing protein n=1 Tax=Panicum virgatum TaxID=38727 RepID=A0A8T0QJL9_PANVG|nr:hypothetical protein PVAP13_7KG284000 [Panicum virgatum]
MSKSLSFFSWNVRGLGQSCRCDDVLAELISSRPSVAAIQETKLSCLSPLKRRTFLPARLKNCVTLDAVGSTGGVLTAWDASICSVDSVTKLSYTLTTSFAVLADGSTFTFSNVYAPTLHEDKPSFLAKLASLADLISGPWMIFGDFNLTRSPADKNTGSFNLSDATRFNDLISSIALVEIPLVDRAYTWSNRRDNPTLVRLDRCFVNLDWDACFPNTALLP